MMTHIHFSAKAGLFGHIFQQKCCEGVLRSRLLLPSVISGLLFVNYRVKGNMQVTIDGVRKSGCSQF